jgi:hypothetical protein
VIRLLSYIFSKFGAFQDDGGRACAYQLDEQHFAVVMPVFFQQLAKFSGDVLDISLGDKTIISIFKQYNWLYCNEEDDQYYSKLALQKGNVGFTLSVAIVKSEPFIKAGAFIKGKIKILAKEYDNVASLMQSDPPLSWFAGSQDELVALAAKRDAHQPQPAADQAEQPQPGQCPDIQGPDEQAQEPQASPTSDHQAGPGQEQQEQSQARDNRAGEQQQEQQKTNWEAKIDNALSVFLQKLQNQEYCLNKTGGIGYIGVDNLLYLLYPKWVDEVFEVKSNFDSVYLNRYRQKILFKLLDSGYIMQYKNGYLFAKLKVMYLSDGKQIYSPEMQYIRLNIDKLINFNPEFEKYLK